MIKVGRRVLKLYFGACLPKNIGFDRASFCENIRLCVILIKNELYLTLYLHFLKIVLLP